MTSAEIAQMLASSQARLLAGIAKSGAPTPAADGTSIIAWLDPLGRLHVLDEAIAAGDDDALNVKATVHKKLNSGVYTPLLVSNFGAATDINVQAAPSNLFAITGENRNAAVRYLQLHNLAGAIGGGAVPLYVWPVPATTGLLVRGPDFLTTEGARFTTGLRVGWSTTEHTYTAGTAADHTTHVHYV